MAVAATFAIGFLVGAWELIGRYWWASSGSFC